MCFSLTVLCRLHRPWLSISFLSLLLFLLLVLFSVFFLNPLCSSRITLDSQEAPLSQSHCCVKFARHFPIHSYFTSRFFINFVYSSSQHPTDLFLFHDLAQFVPACFIDNSCEVGDKRKSSFPLFPWSLRLSRNSG